MVVDGRVCQAHQPPAANWGLSGPEDVTALPVGEGLPGGDGPLFRMRVEPHFPGGVLEVDLRQPCPWAPGEMAAFGLDLVPRLGFWVLCGRSRLGLDWSIMLRGCTGKEGSGSRKWQEQGMDCREGLPGRVCAWGRGGVRGQLGSFSVA